MKLKELVSLNESAGRFSPHDAIQEMLPKIAALALENLQKAKAEHERKFGPKSDDEDAYNFELNEDALMTEIESILQSLTDEISDAGSIRNMKSLIKSADLGKHLED